MADILIAKINNTIEAYLPNMRPLLSKIFNHANDIEHLDKPTLTGLLEQASDFIMLFQQNFEVNYYTLLKFPPSNIDNQLTEFAQTYKLSLLYVGVALALAVGSGIDKDDYPVLRPFMGDLIEHPFFCLDLLGDFLALSQPFINGNMAVKTETETESKPEPKTETVGPDMDLTDQPLVTLDNTPPTTSDTPIPCDTPMSIEIQTEPLNILDQTA